MKAMQYKSRIIYLYKNSRVDIISLYYIFVKHTKKKIQIS